MGESPASVTLERVRASSLGALRAEAARASCGERWIAADASLGFFRARHLASELAAQVGIALAGQGDARADLATQGGAPSLAEMIGAGVDAEARGDEAVRRALEDARAIASAAAAREVSGVLILEPRGDGAWPKGERRFVEFLARALDAPRIPLRVVATDPDEGHEDARAGKTLWGILPGLAEQDVASLVESRAGAVPLAHTLPNGALLVAPELRPATRPASRARYDALAVAVAGTWREAYAQLHGNNLFVDGALLAREAWRQFSLGGVDIALRYLARAAECAESPAARGVLEAQAQGMRLASLRFAEAAAASEGGATLDPKLRGFLHQAKGWGMVMTGGAAEAEPLLQAARALLAADEGSIEYLYLLNISALAKLRQGRFDEALALEERIAREADERGCTDERLRYINSINLARLYRRGGDLTRARSLYERAFATTLGARSESDHVYGNATLAMLDEAAGQIEPAARGWMRASLHWLASEAPEAIGERAASGIVGRAPAASEDVVELVSGALATRLAERAPVDAALEAPCTFALAKDGARVSRVVTAEGLTVLVAEGGAARVRRGPCYEQLRALVWRRLRLARGGSALEGARAVLVDDRFGQEIGAGARDALAACIRFSCERAWVDGAEVAIDARARAALFSAAIVRIAPAVLAMEEGDGVSLVRFRRYRAPLRLRGTVREMVRAVSAANGITLDALSRAASLSSDEAGESLADLQRARVLDWELTEAACTAAGIR